jgi:hypothetical protein
MIGKREIFNGMAHHSSQALGISRGDVFRQTLSTNGAKQMTTRIENLLDVAVEWALESGRLVKDSGRNFLGE